MAILLASEESGWVGKPTHVNIVRFAPPLVIEEKDLEEAVKIIGECLIDLDQLDEIQGEDTCEKEHADILTL